MDAPSMIGRVTGTIGKPWGRRSDRQWAGKQRWLPAEQLLAEIPSLPRACLARLTEQMIDRMDRIDGNSDVEANGDELDGTGSEDDFIAWPAGLMGSWSGSGCPVGDPGGDSSDVGGILTPVFGIDQSLGPINETTGAAEHSVKVRGY